MDKQQLCNTVEAILFSADKPLSISQLSDYFIPKEQVNRQDIKATVLRLQQQYSAGGIELKQVERGYRFQTRAIYKAWVAKHHVERTSKYSRALLETLAIIAYRQPTTRAEIENIRGVSVSSAMIKTLEERQWIRVVGYKEVPGRPAMLGTTREFLDYFNLKGLNDLPALADLIEIKELNFSLNFKEAKPIH
jgi:segregation and condensation protein B